MLWLASGGFWREIFISDGVNMCRQNWFRHLELQKKQLQKSSILLLSSSYKRFSIYPKKKVLQVVQVAQVVSYFLFTFCWQLFCTTKLSLKLQIGRHCYTLLLITHFYYFYSKVLRCFFFKLYVKVFQYLFSTLFGNGGFVQQEVLH